MLEYPSSSTDLSLIDLYLFMHLKTFFAGHRLNIENSIQKLEHALLKISEKWPDLYFFTVLLLLYLKTELIFRTYFYIGSYLCANDCFKDYIINWTNNYNINCFR